MILHRLALSNSPVASCAQFTRGSNSYISPNLSPPAKPAFLSPSGSLAGRLEKRSKAGASSFRQSTVCWARAMICPVANASVTSCLGGRAEMHPVCGAIMSAESPGRATEFSNLTILPIFLRISLDPMRQVLPWRATVAVSCIYCEPSCASKRITAS